MDIKVYQYWRSSCSWRVRWALNYKKLPYETIAVNLLKSEQQDKDYVDKNPSQFVPTMVVDGQTFTESLPFIEWLDEVKPEPALLPNSPHDRFKVRQLASLIASGTQPLQNLMVLKYYSKTQEDKMRIGHHWIERGLKVYEKVLQETAGTYSFGSQLSIADLCLIPQVYNANRFKVDMGQFPKSNTIFKRCMERQDCIESAPENQSDAV